jgi:hypothetical protein
MSIRAELDTQGWVGVHACDRCPRTRRLLGQHMHRETALLRVRYDLAYSFAIGWRPVHSASGQVGHACPRCAARIAPVAPPGA